LGGGAKPNEDSGKAGLFDAVGHPARVRIMRALDRRPLNFSELKEVVGTESSGHLTWHLDKLSRLVEADPNGVYRLTPEGQEALALVDAAAESERLASPAGVQRRRPAWKAVLLAGVVLFVVGLALVSVASAGAGNAGSANNSVPLTQYAQGEYVSKQFNLSSSGFLTVTSPDPGFDLVKSSQLSMVAPQNVGQYAVTPTSSAGSVSTYQGLTGSYTVVEFYSGSATPTVSYATGSFSSLAAYSASFLGGAALAVAGAAVTITGVFLRWRGKTHAKPKSSTIGPR
jgi:DNA-binding transcriptional ArsR family regulator